MPIYYRDLEITVTDTMVDIGPRRFRIAELQYVWHQRGRPTLRTTSRRLSRFVLIALILTPVAFIGLLVANAVSADREVLARVGTVAVLAVLGVILFMLFSPLIEIPMMALERSYDRGNSVLELWVRWRDQDLMLLRTADASRFGKIYRAIQRAVERTEG